MEILNLIFTYVIGPAVTLLFGGWIGKRMAKAEAAKKDAETAKELNESKALELENIQTGLKIYREMTEDLTNRLKEREGALMDLKHQLEEIASQNKELLTKMTHLERDYSKLQKNYNDLKNSINK